MPSHEPLPGFTFGGPDGATYGDPAGATYGPQTRDVYRARLTTVDGRRADIESVEKIDLALEHTAVSDVALTIPRIDGLADFALGDLDVYFGDSLLFQATLEKFPGPAENAGDTATVEGRGPARSLARGSTSVDYSGTEAATAIEQFWRDHTSFTATVTDPASSTTLGDADLDGTPLEVLKELHKRAGMRFTVQHTQPGKRVHSFPRGGVTKQGTWTSISSDASGDVTGYANQVVVEGGTKSGGGLATATATDQDEVDALDGQVVEWPITDHTLTTDADCQAVADEELAKRADRDTLSGTIDIIPELVLPGYHYDIPEWDSSTQPVDSVKYTESVGDASARLEVNAPEGVVDVLAAVRTTQSDVQHSLR